MARLMKSIECHCSFARVTYLIINNNRFTLCTLWSLVFIPLGDARGFNNPIIIVMLCDIIMHACVHACVFTCTCGFVFFCVCVWVWVCACMWSIYISVPFVFRYWPLSPGCVCVYMLWWQGLIRCCASLY